MTLIADHPLPFLEEAVRRAPRELSYRTLLAEACLREGDTARAIEILASSLDPAAKPRTIYVLALALLAVDRSGEAKSAATEAIRLNPEMDRAYYVRGLARRSQGDFAGAFVDLRAANDVRPDVKYVLAFARAAIEAATASSPAATPDLLKKALISVEAAQPAGADERERQYLGTLLAFALDDPAKAIELLKDPSGDPKLALLRGYALLATGRGGEATTDLRIARDVPETSAAASRLLTAFRERGRVRPSLADALLAAGVPAWPEIKAMAPRLVPAPSESWPYTPAPRERSAADDSTDLDFDEDAAPSPRTAGSESEVALDRARTFLAEGKPDAAVRDLEYAWDLVRPGTSPLPASEAVPRQLLQALAEALAVAYEQSSRGGVAPRRVRDEELYAAGSRYPALIRSLVQGFIHDEPREDPFALDVLVTAVETPGVLLNGAVADVLRHLVAALRLDLEDEPAAVEARVPLLERLHRTRPGLAFPRLYLGRHALRSGDPERALAFLASLAGPLGDSAQVLILRAVCAESLGDSKRALELYCEAHIRAPQLPDLSYRIGRVLLLRAAAAAPGSAGAESARINPSELEDSLDDEA